ncbi:MAG: hypothetical protein ABIH03_06860 [Pseudomonadota bacterium]
MQANDPRLASLPGEVIAAAQVAVLRVASGPPSTQEIAPLFGGNAVVGARIGEGAGFPARLIKQTIQRARALFGVSCFALI